MGVGGGVYMYDVVSSRSLSHLLMSCCCFYRATCRNRNVLALRKRPQANNIVLQKRD